MVRRSYVKIGAEDRQKIKSKYRQGISTKGISDALEMNYWTVAKIVKRLQDDGEPDAKSSGGDRRSKLDSFKKDQIRAWVDENCLLTLQALSGKVREIFDLSVSYSTIDRCLRQFHYTVKQTTVVPEPRNNESTKLKRFEYARKFRDYEITHSPEKLIFLDEVGFSVSSRPKRGRSLRGTSASVDVPAVRTRNISVLAAMNVNCMIYSEIHEKALNGEDFKSNLRGLKEACEAKGITNPVFIMDNARIHHYSGLEEVIQEFNLVFEYLPPYSPFLNPIENCFSKWKNFVLKKCARNEEELRGLIVSGFDEINSEDCGGYFRKMLRYIVRSERNEEILE